MRSQVGARPLGVCLLAGLTGACAEAPSDSSTVRRDSAGVEIVEIAIGSGSESAFAILEDVPSLRLGSIDGAPEEQFGRVSDVLPLSDGGVAVLDGLVAEVRLFDADGAYRTTLGSKGEGPGQFDRPSRLGLTAGDTLAVFDGPPRRITRFAPDGTLGRVTTLRETRARVTTGGFLVDGRFIGQSALAVSGGTLPPSGETVLRRDSTVLTLFGAEGDVQDTLDVQPGTEFVTRIERTGDGISVLRRPAVYARTNLFAANPLGVWSATNDRFELRLVDLSGRLVRVARASGLERPVTTEFDREIRDQALAEAPSQSARQMTEAWLELSPRPEVQPAFDRWVVDASANLWVREWSTPEPSGRWWVFASDGALLGEVQVPSGLQVMAIGCDGIWGVELDEYDVSYVVSYAMQRSTPC